MISLLFKNKLVLSLLKIFKKNLNSLFNNICFKKASAYTNYMYKQKVLQQNSLIHILVNYKLECSINNKVKKLCLLKIS
jgi:hypothetical protein